MRVGDIVSVLEDFAPLSIQEDWDNSGLIVGSAEQEINGVLIGFDCTPDLVDEAVACGAGMIVTHHPLIFGGLKRISPDDPTGLTIIKAVSSGIVWLVLFVKDGLQYGKERRSIGKCIG